MADKLFLLDGMALIYRAHYAFISNPISTSRGFITSAIFGFANTLLEIIQKRQPTYLALALDTSAPTKRHQEYPEYKAQRAKMPEELSAAIPHVKRLARAFRVPVLSLDGYEADDIIGALSLKAEQASPDIEIYMVTPDKDFAQLVSPQSSILKPGRRGTGAEILGLEEIRTNWQVDNPSQVIDILGLWGDSSDNIPGVPGIGEKTAKKLIAKFGSVEALLESTGQLKGKQKENVENFRDQALLSKRLVTIDRQTPLQQIDLPEPLLTSAGGLNLELLKLQPADDDMLLDLLVSFEFDSLAKRLYGSGFKSGRGHIKPLAPGDDTESVAVRAKLSTINDVEHHYHTVTDAAGRASLAGQLEKLTSFCFDTETSALDAKAAQLTGMSFSWRAGHAYYVVFSPDQARMKQELEVFRPVLEDDNIEKIGHNLKYDVTVLRWHGIRTRGRLFDTMLAHSLTHPDQRHAMNDLAETLLSYKPISITSLIGGQDTEADGQLSMLEAMDQKPEDVAQYAAEDADITWRLAAKLRPMLKDTGQETVFYKVEAPLTTVLAELEYQGITVDAAPLAEFSGQLAAQMERVKAEIYRVAGNETFNLNSPQQLGQILFDRLKLADKPKKTRTGQYKTDEQTLLALRGSHRIIDLILEYRKAAKLKNTYVDALPLTVSGKTGRVHTHFDQLMTATGRLVSNNPNLQNIPIRTEQGREIRKAFVPRGPEYSILAADYSQIELRVMASLSGDKDMRQAFAHNLDIHQATAARVYGVDLAAVTPEMRSRAKMVNFGIIYGITAFGLAQRLAIPRKEAEAIIKEYFKQYGGVKEYMDRTIASAKETGYVETITGRRRYIADIKSRNWNLRNAAERTAINTPVQGSAADMIKLAMIRIARDLEAGEYRTKMLLQVHDELVFDLHQEEQQDVVPMIVKGMKEAMPLDVPIIVDIGTGANWLEAH